MTSSHYTRQGKHTLSNQYGQNSLELELKSGHLVAPTLNVHFHSLLQKSVKKMS